jgi:signal transduction histidine kinase
VPLKTEGGFNVGALCVLDYEKREISPEKVELLKIIAKEIMTRLATTKLMESLKNQVKEANAEKTSVAHDIRGPLSGIMNLAEVISHQGEENKIEDILQFVKLIYKSSHSLLELADEILTNEKGVSTPLGSDELNLLTFKQTLEKLYSLQAQNKKIDYSVNIADEEKNVPFSKNKLLQITGNLISNAIKFTPENGKIEVDLRLLVRTGEPNLLSITVKDSGVGIDSSRIQEIIAGNSKSSGGTSGEKGYGFGLALVKHLVESLKGTMEIDSSANSGTSFIILLPQKT